MNEICEFHSQVSAVLSKSLKKSQKVQRRNFFNYILSFRSRPCVISFAQGVQKIECLIHDMQKIGDKKGFTLRFSVLQSH